MVTCWFFSAVCCLQAISSLASSQATGSYRLPLEVVPRSYSIQLIPYLDEGDSSRQFTFDGNVSILVQAKRAESKITLHALDIEIHGLPIVTEADSGNPITVNNVSRDLYRDFLILNLGEALNVGSSYRIAISYTGILNDNLDGFYRSSYTVNGTTRWLATTQFESTSARAAFPSFDEPALKATFDISIARLPEMNAISNMPLKSTVGPDSALNGRYWDTFETTLKMSTYLVAFIVSDFQALQNGIYRIWAQPPRVQEGKFALEASPKLIKELERITGIAYQLPKMDEVAVPDFAAGAMENWGLVTYRLNRLLLPSNGSDADASSIASVIAHEFAHQWFGDLVTLNWWKFTWLNEGFANFFENYATDQVYPQWRLIDSQVSSTFSLMSSDVNNQRDPLTNDVDTPTEISAMFGTTSYNKGGAILRMIQHALTTDTFFKGLNRYLTARSYSDATADDLSAGLQKGVDEDNALEDGLTVKAIVDTWTLQSGFPVVTVTRNYSAGTAALQQDEFVTNGVSPSKQWYIPVSYTTSNQPDFNTTKPSLWLRPNSNAVLRNLPGENNWIILNVQATGYFRVNYDQQNWELLLNILNGADYEQIHEYNRAQLISDSRYFYEGNQLDVKTAIGIQSYLERETHPAPWAVALEGLESLYDKMGGSPYFPALQKFYLRLMGQFYERIGFEPRAEESPLISRVRPKLLHWACLFGHEACVKSAERSVTKARITADHRVNEKVRASVYCAAVRNNGESIWKWMWNVYQTTKDVKERQHALKALGCTSDSHLLKRLLGLILHENSGLQPQDRINVFSAVCSGRDAAACDLVLKFVAKRMDTLADLFGEYDSVATILHRVASKLKTPQQVSLLSTILLKNRENLPEAVSSNARRMAQENVDWLSGMGEELAKWLQSQRTVNGV